MDLQLILRVVWRFRLLVACGLLIAVALSVMSYVRVGLADGKPSFEYRQAEQWESLSTLFVTSRGFPWGSIDTQSSGPLAGRADQAAGARQDAAAAESDGAAAREDGTPAASATPTPLDPANLTALAGLYVQLATSDPVYRIMSFVPGRDGALQAFPVTSDPTGRGDTLPMVTLSAIAGTPADAQKLAARHAEAFVTYLRREQRRAEIPASERVVVEVVRQPQAPTLLEGRKKTRPMVVFVAIMIAVLGLAFALENLRPRVRVLPSAQEPLEPVAAEPVRRSA
jgi:hypothetical protein